MITTTHGDMDESTLRKVEGGFEDDNEQTSWVEYYLGDEMVPRSVHINLKRGLGVEAAIGAIGG